MNLSSLNQLKFIACHSWGGNEVKKAASAKLDRKLILKSNFLHFKVKLLVILHPQKATRNAMPNQLLNLDRQLFYWINHDISNTFFDWLMPLLRTPVFWIPLYIFIIVFFVRRYQKQGLLLIILLAIAAGFADYTSAHVIKRFIKRDRPCRDAAIAATRISLVPCGTGYSFPSTHATDHFAIAVFLSCVLYKKYNRVLPAAMLWAAAICFAQIYVGVHYPFDVLCGALYGAFIGWLFALLFKQLQPDGRA